MLNLLRASRRNPKLSAYAILKGEFNFNKSPLVPPGSKELLYKDTKLQTSFAPHAKYAWYIEPAMQYYCCCKFWLPKTGGTRIAKTAKFFPPHFLMLTINKCNITTLTAKDLVDVLRNPKTAKIVNLIPSCCKALEDLASIFV